MKRTELVAGIADAGGGVGREYIHLLKLPHDRGAVAGDRSTDPWQHRIGSAEFFAVVIDMRISLIETDREAQGVENLDFMSAFAAGLNDAARRITLGGARQNGEFHGIGRAQT